MIFVDDRAGSAELAQPLHTRGLPVELTRLDYGDIAFEGRGERNTPCWIGIEFKRLEEFIASSRSERLQGYQLPGMRATYAHSYLLIEGELHYDSHGALQQFGAGKRLVAIPGRMSINELLKRLLVLHLRGGLHPWLAACRRDSLTWLEALYHCWTDVALDQHESHIGVYSAPSLHPISDFRRAVCTWPGIGVRLSKAVEQAFGGSLQRATCAGVDEWARIETVSEKGRKTRLGYKQAQAIVDFCRGTNG